MKEQRSGVVDSTARGELILRIGDQTRTFTWRGPQRMALQRALEMDPWAFVTSNKGDETFCSFALFCGMDRTAQKKADPIRIAGWIDTWCEDNATDYDALKREILYAMARCYPGNMAEERVRLLDSIYDDEGEEEGKRRVLPFSDAGSKTASGTS